MRVNLLYNSIKRMPHDGLSNLHNLNVKVIEVKMYALCTFLRIYVSEASDDYFNRWNYGWNLD